MPTNQPASASALPDPPSDAAQAHLSPQEEKAVFSKMTWRLIPLLFCCYIIAYIDRINVGFAKLQLRPVLQVDEASFDAVFGLGAGLFFIGYFLFEVPSNLVLQRVGARIWIARIMVVWGFVSMGFMFLQGKTMFYVMRFLLGAAEAGFFPGVLLYLTYWFPSAQRARTVAMFATGGILAGVVGSPISGAILGMNGVAGMAGWQWLFLLEALPALVMGLVVLVLLPNGPEQTKWLTPMEKAWLRARLAEDAAKAGVEPRHRLRDAFTNPMVWHLCLLYFLMNVGGYGYELWLPSIIKSFSGLSDAEVGFITAIPYLVAGIVMLWVGRHSDRTQERKGHVAVAAFTAAVGFGLSASFKNPYLAMAALTLAFVGMKSTLGPFWAMGSSVLSGTAAAGGIALINSVGNLGGFVGPYLVGTIKARTQSNLAALLCLGAALLGMAILALLIRPARPGGQAVSKG